jgi:hypothetical protein
LGAAGTASAEALLVCAGEVTTAALGAGLLTTVAVAAGAGSAAAAGATIWIGSTLLSDAGEGGGTALLTGRTA